MKKHLFSIVIIVMFLVGFSVLLYPAVSAYVNSRNASHLIDTYHETLTNAEDDTLNRIIAEAEAYNQKLRQNESAFFDPSLVPDYEETLDITGTGIMGYIDIDRIHVELPIYHSVENEVLQIGAGHLPGSSLPVGGASTHCVLTGHRGLPSARLFTDLDQLEIGDEFRITVLNRCLTYRIDQIETVLPTEYADLMTVRGLDYCTLVTCTPYGINTHRLLVRGVRVETAEEKPGIFVRNEAFLIDPLIVTPLMMIPLLLICLLLVILRGKLTAIKPGKNETESHGKER